MSNKRNLYLVSFIFNILSCVSVGILLIPLLWCVPITIKSYQAYKGEDDMSMGYSICDLLFVNLIGGIFALLAMNSDY